MTAPVDDDTEQQTVSCYGKGSAVTIWITAKHKAFLARIGQGERPISDGARRAIEAHPEWKEND